MQALNAFVVVASLFVSTVVAAAPAQLPYNVTVEAEEGSLHIGLETKKTYSSMCGRKTTELKITEPKSAPGMGIPRPALGLVSFKTALKSNTMCMMAFGPHRGGLTLAIGDAMPALAPGYYALEIDGKNYGYLLVSEDGAELLSSSQLPQ